MPTLILTGHPCSSKTTFAEVLAARAKAHTKSKDEHSRITSTIIINESTVRPGKTLRECYANSTEEKMTRAALKNEFEKYCSGAPEQKNTLVILDSMNYIKGYRYELHCIAKAAGQKHGVIWVLCHPDVVMGWNHERQSMEEGKHGKDDDNVKSKKDYYYTEEQMKELMLRYEPPDQRNRWDRPLYRVDVTSTLSEELLSKHAGQQQQHQQNTIDGSKTDAVGKTAEEVLNKSVYNMHSLSDAIRDESQSKVVTSKQRKVGTQSNTTSSSSSVATATTITSTTTSSFHRATPKNISGNGGGRVVRPKGGGFRRNTTKKSAVEKKKIDEEISPKQSYSENHVNESNANKTPTLLIDTNTTPNKSSAPQSSAEQQQQQPKTMEELIDSILDSFLLDVEQLKEGLSTKLNTSASSNVLHEVDTICQKTTNAFLNAQKASSSAGAGVGGTLMISLNSGSGNNVGSGDVSVYSMQTNRTIQVIEMKRYKRQYIKWISDHPPKDTSENGIAKSFLSYVENQI